MTARSPAAAVVTTLVATALLAAAVQLQAARERIYPRDGEAEESLYLRSGATLSRMSGAFRAVTADVYWIRAIQYYGGMKRQLDARRALGPVSEPPPAIGAGAYPLLYPLLDITTTLDPRFNIAYRFGAVYLGEAYPRGANRPEQK